MFLFAKNRHLYLGWPKKEAVGATVAQIVDLLSISGVTATKSQTVIRIALFIIIYPADFKFSHYLFLKDSRSQTTVFLL